MKKYFCIFGLGFMLQSCINSHNEVIIKSVSDTVNVGERFSAKLYLKFDTTYAPSFFIFVGKDTFRLNVDDHEKCAQFKAVESKVGEKTYNGYVDFINPKGASNRKLFSIKFYVKQKNP
jgi:hypothetical protein